MRRVFSSGDLLRCASLPDGWSLTGQFAGDFGRIRLAPSFFACYPVISAVSMPLHPQSPDEVKSSSASLMLGAAIVLTADDLPPPQAKLLTALARALRFHPDNFRKSRPVLEEISLAGIPGRIVRDGTGRRAYFCGAPGTLMQQCSQIWDGRPRPVETADLALLPPDDTSLAFATAEVTPDGPGELIYLGSVTFRMIQSPDVLRAVNTFRTQGYDVDMLRNDDDATPDTLLISDRPLSLPPSQPMLIAPAADGMNLTDAVSAVSLMLECARIRRQKALQRSVLATTLCLALMALCAVFLFAAGVPGFAYACLLMLLLPASTVLPGRLRHSALYAVSGAVLVLLLAVLAVLLTPLQGAGAAFSVTAGLLCSLLLQLFLSD